MNVSCRARRPPLWDDSRRAPIVITSAPTGVRSLPAPGEILRTGSGHRYGMGAVRFSPDGRFVLSSGRDAMVAICQLSDGKEVAALGKRRGGQFKDGSHATAVSSDLRTVAADDFVGKVPRWQPYHSRFPLLRVDERFPRFALRSNLCPDGRFSESR